MNFQWYPGHMTKAKRQMQEDIKAYRSCYRACRCKSSFGKQKSGYRRAGENKYRLILMNKADLADKEKDKTMEQLF